MKRALFENVRVKPYTSGAAIDREGFLSGLLHIDVGTITGSPTAAKVTVAATHCDTSNGTFAAPDDTLVFPGGKEFDIDMTATTPALDKTIPVDFVGCKRYVKLTVTVAFTGGSTPASTNAFAIALGDRDMQPVE